MLKVILMELKNSQTAYGHMLSMTQQLMHRLSRNTQKKNSSIQGQSIKRDQIIDSLQRRPKISNKWKNGGRPKRRQKKNLSKIGEKNCNG